MLYQHHRGIYTYHYDIIGVLMTNYYRDLNHFFLYKSEFYINTIIVDNIAQHNNHILDGEYFTGYKTIICDETGRIYTKDRILGLYRKWIKIRYSNNSYTHHAGFKAQVYSRYKRPKTTQEKRFWFNYDEDNNVRGRSKRSKCNLIESWDDVRMHNDKSWKTQSKHKHQYK